MSINNDSEGPRLSADAMEALGQRIDIALNGGAPESEHLGFALLVFPFGGPGISQYASNAKREGMIKALRETADRLEKHQDNSRVR